MKKHIIPILFAVLVSAVSFAQVKNYHDIKYPEARAPHIVKPYEFKLKNGLTVLLMEDHELPVVKGKIMFHTGSVADPKGKEGLADLTAETMRTAGNAIMSGDKMDDFLEGLAASIESSAGDVSARVNFNCLKENADKVMDLFRATVEMPTFAEAQVEVAKQQLKTGIVRRNDDPKGIASREFTRRVYGLQSPLSAMEELASIDAITTADLKSFHGKWYVPNNAVLAVWGDFDRKAMEKKINMLFTDWGSGNVKLPPLNIHSAKPGVYFVKRDGVTQSNIIIGHLGQERTNPDLPAMAIFSRLLGGGFDSRMMKIIRRNMGLSYSPHGGIGTDWAYPGAFSMRINTKLESTGKVIETARSIVEDLQKNGVTQEELVQARDGYINSFVFQFDSLDKIINRALTYKFYGYPANFTETLFNGLKKVTRDDIKRVANKYIDLNKAIIMVVGDSSHFDKPLSEFGPVTDVDVTIPKPKVKQDNMAVTKESLAKGTALLKAAIHSLDPEGKLPGVKIWKQEDEAPVEKMGMISAIRYADNSMLKKMQTQMGVITFLITPQKAEMRMGPRKRSLPIQQKEQMLASIDKSLPALARLAQATTPKANLIKTAEFDGKPASFVVVSTASGPVTLIIGKDNTILGTTTQVMNRTGSMETLTSIWRKLKDFGGIRYPEIIEQKQGQTSTVIMVKNITINPENGDQLFQ